MGPMDHGVTIGPIQGIEDMQQTINQLTEGGVDAVLVHKGIAKRVDINGAGLIVNVGYVKLMQKRKWEASGLVHISVQRNNK